MSLRPGYSRRVKAGDNSRDKKELSEPYAALGE